MQRGSLCLGTAILLVVAIFSLVTGFPVASQSYVTQTVIVTGTITNTSYSKITYTTYTNSTTMSTQLYSGVFNISPNQNFGSSYGNCASETLPLDLQAGEKITGSVNADGNVYFGIETTDQYHLQFLPNIIPTTCQAYVSYSSDQNTGKSFNFNWKAPSSGTFYFIIVNADENGATKISLQVSVDNRIVISNSAEYRTQIILQTQTVNSTITTTTTLGPGIPGFFNESLIFGLALGLTVVILLRTIKRIDSTS